MFVHAASCLPGPTTRTRHWWSAPRSSETPIRTELVERVRGEIAAGTYDTPEKLEIALDRLMRTLED